jgi:hypothetical protein
LIDTGPADADDGAVHDEVGVRRQADDNAAVAQRARRQRREAERG